MEPTNKEKKYYLMFLGFLGLAFVVSSILNPPVQKEKKDEPSAYEKCIEANRIAIDDKALDKQVESITNNETVEDSENEIRRYIKETTEKCGHLI